MGLAWRGDLQGRRCPTPARVFCADGVAVTLSERGGNEDQMAGNPYCCALS